MRHRKLPQHHGVEQAVDGGVGTDPERQRKDVKPGLRRISRRA
jgi:hypothetical protein